MSSAFLFLNSGKLVAIELSPAVKLPPLTKATLVKRYKRFLADVVLESGEEMTVHCPNTGAMTGCAEPGAVVWLSESNNSKRKYRFTWELLQTGGGDIVCIHSAKANHLASEALESEVIGELKGYDSIQKEVAYGEESSRVDLLLKDSSTNLAPCYVEVKSVTLLSEQGRGLFPDAPSLRGQKHLRELTSMADRGHRAVLLFCVLHSGIQSVAPADSIDFKYGCALREAVARGVEVIAYKASFAGSSIALTRAVEVVL